MGVLELHPRRANGRSMKRFLFSTELDLVHLANAWFEVEVCLQVD
jgi:hypothetical protein